MVVMVWLRNSRGEFLISRRSSAKSYPLCWEPTGGSALAGESSVEAACREVREELGITLDPIRGKHVARAPRAYDGCDDFVDVWLFDDVEVAIEEVVVQQEEVSEAMWASPKKIRTLVEAGSWIPWEKYNPLETILSWPMSE